MKNYKQILFILLVIFFIAQMAANIYAYSDDSGWGELKIENPLLYKVLIFLNPPFLDNVFGFIITIMGAIGIIMVIPGFEGGTKIIMILLSLYLWARILSFFVVISLVGKGVLAP